MTFSALPTANIEIKAQGRDPEMARRRAASLATDSLGTEHQIDTYFHTPRGRMKLRESTLTGAHLVAYRRPDQPGPKRSDYLLIPVPAADRLKKLFTELFGVRCVVTKAREIFMYQNVRIHLDHVMDLGDYIELEAVFNGDPALEAGEREKIDFLMHELGITETDLIATSYETLLQTTAGGYE